MITSRLKRWASAKGSLIVCDHVPRPSEDAFDAGRIGRESGDPQHLDLAVADHNNHHADHKQGKIETR